MLNNDDLSINHLVCKLQYISLPFAEEPLFIVFAVTFGCVGLFWGMISLLRYLD